MDDARSHDSAPHSRLDSISDEIRAMNSLILARVDKLRGQPELVAQLIRRCEELSVELKAISTTGQTNGGAPGGPEPSLDGSGLQA